MSNQTPGRVITNKLITPAIILGGFVALIWLLEIIDTLLLNQSLNRLGIWPRHLIGLRGILFMPFLHGDLGHVAANTFPFLFLGAIVMLRSVRDFVIVTLTTMLFSGIVLWLFGNERAIYIGASGLVFGYFGFLLLRSYFDRSVQSIAIALVIFLLYGGLIFGLFPQQPGVSWGAHLSGFVGGALAAWFIARSRPGRSPIIDAPDFQHLPTEPEDNIADQIHIL